MQLGMPNAVVAIDHSPWNSDDVSKKFWDAMKPSNYDLVWTTGVGNNSGFINADGKAGVYNGTTAKYSWLKSYTGKPVIVTPAPAPPPRATPGASCRSPI